MIEQTEQQQFIESILDGSAHTQRWQAKYTGLSLRKLQALEKKVLAELRKSVSASAEYQQEIAIAQLQATYAAAMRLGEVNAAVAARKELNLLLNLYNTSAGGAATENDAVAALSDEELEAEIRDLLKSETHA